MPANFEILEIERSHVTIRDLSDRAGGPSITNDAENVVRLLRSYGYLLPGRRLFYYDTMGRRDEITWDEAGKIGFSQ